jgi:hypothetical protein
MQEKRERTSTKEETLSGEKREVCEKELDLADIVRDVQ